MVDRLARVVAQIYGQASRSIRRPVSANPAGAGHLSARIKGDRLDRTRGMPFANRLCPVENMLRQNVSI
jgi:hypothetical protein